VLEQGYCLFCQRNEVKYRFIAQNKKTYPVDRMCQLLRVKRSGFYRWAKIEQEIDPTHTDMIEWVKKIAVASDNT
jgi:putative transposase